MTDRLFDILLPYQRRWVLDARRFKIGVWSRQVGKSFATAFEADLDCIQTPRTDWLVMSAGQRQSDEWMLKALAVARGCEAGLAGTKDAGAAKFTASASEIRFANGSRILSLPANPDTARG